MLITSGRCRLRSGLEIVQAFQVPSDDELPWPCACGRPPFVCRDSKQISPPEFVGPTRFLVLIRPLLEAPPTVAASAAYPYTQYHCMSVQIVRTCVQTDTHGLSHLYTNLPESRAKDAATKDRSTSGLHAIGYRLITHKQNLGSYQQIQLGPHICTSRRDSARCGLQGHPRKHSGAHPSGDRESRVQIVPHHHRQ